MAVHFFESETVTPLNRNTRAEGVTVATTQHSSFERHSEIDSSIVSNGDSTGSEDRAHAQDPREHEALPQQERTYVLDTSVLLSDPRALFRFAEHSVVLPVVVITELEKKRHDPEIGYFARRALRLLDELRDELREETEPSDGRTQQAAAKAKSKGKSTRPAKKRSPAPERPGGAPGTDPTHPQ